MSATDVVTPPPGPPSSPYPADGAVGASNAPALTWAPAAYATSYDVYLGITPNPPLVTTVSSNGYSSPELSGLTTYYWKVVPKNTCGSASGSPTWAFTTVSPPQVTTVKALQSPFRLKVSGANFQAGAAIKVNGQAVPETSFTSSSQLVAKKGDALKALVPKGTQVCVSVTNPDGGVKVCFAYVR